jgi:hypothetical protein
MFLYTTALLYAFVCAKNPDKCRFDKLGLAPAFGEFASTVEPLRTGDVDLDQDSLDPSPKTRDPNFHPTGVVLIDFVRHSIR